MTQREMPRKPKILVAWDGSPAAGVAFPVARVIGAQLGADVDVLHVHPAGLKGAELGRLVDQEWIDLTGFGLRIDVGEPASGILAAAEDPRVALVVLTTHGRSLQEGSRLGSVTEEVVVHVRRPVLLVRPEASLEATPAPLKRLLLPCDGTPKTATALRPVTRFAARLGAAIDVLYVSNKQSLSAEKGTFSVPRYVDQPHHEWPSWAQEAIDRLMGCFAACPPEVPVQMFLAHGDVGSEIAAFAASHKTDGIVLVRRSRLQPGRARILRAVLDLTPCPVLLVGAPED